MEIRPISEDFVNLRISEHTLAERTMSDGRYAEKKFERAITYIICALAAGVVLGMGKFVTDKFINNSNSPVRVESAYDN